MNYRKSKQILEEIKRSNRILLNCHRNPDSDAIGSALAMYAVLTGLKKEVEIICPSENLFENINFLNNYYKIQTKINFSSFNFAKFDIFITMDSSSWEVIADLKNFIKPHIKTIVIDHHFTNTFYGDLNLIDAKATSVSEVLYLIFQDWGIDIDKNIADCLLTGIIGDTGAFKFPKSGQNTLRIAADLMDKGADKDKIIFNIYMSEPFSLIRFYGKVFSSANLDKKGRFVWTAIPYEVYRRLNLPTIAKESASSLLAQVVEGTDFGFVILEQEPNVISVSFRSRTGVDVSEVARKLGGGGHIYASGARLEGKTFDSAKKVILEVARKFAKENSQNKRL